MATDRITKVVVLFENADGSEKLERSYSTVPHSTFIKDQQPQGRIQGKLEVFGTYTHFKDLY